MKVTRANCKTAQAIQFQCLFVKIYSLYGHLMILLFKFSLPWRKLNLLCVLLLNSFHHIELIIVGESFLFHDPYPNDNNSHLIHFAHLFIVYCMHDNFNEMFVHIMMFVEVVVSRPSPICWSYRETATATLAFQTCGCVHMTLTLTWMYTCIVNACTKII